MSATECGAACLAMIYGSLGAGMSLRQIRHDTQLGRDGLSALDLVKHARSRGLLASGLSVASLQQLTRVQLPAIAYWKDSHFVVIERITGRGVVVFDPAAGRMVLSESDFKADFRHVVVQITRPPEAEIQEHSADPHALKSLMVFAWSKSKVMLMAAVLAAILMQIIGILSANLSGRLIDASSTGGVLDVTSLVPSLGLLLAGVAIISASQAVVSASLIHRLDRTLAERFFEKLTRLKFSSFQMRSSGDILARMTSNSVARDMISTKLVAGAVDSLFVMVFVIYILAVSPLFAGLTVLASVFPVCIVLALRRPILAANRREIAADSQVQAFAVDAVRSIEQLAASRQMGAVYLEWQRRFSSYFQHAGRRRRLDAVAQWVVAFSRLATPLLLLVVGALLSASGSISIGSVFTLSVLAGFVLTPVYNLVSLVRDVQSLRVHLDRVNDILDEEEDNAAMRTALPPQQMPAIGVGLNEVSYCYPGSGTRDVLRKISFGISAGECVGIVGVSGSGKSTLLRAIAGLITPTAGSIELVSPIDTQRQGMVGVVTQDTNFFGTSIRQNLLFGMPEESLPSEQDIMEVLDMVALSETVRAMPLGIDTPLADGGSYLSGGERQRLAFARALMWKPSLLLLDEATSSLDSMTEQLISDAVQRLKMTRVIVAHRLSTVSACDKILVLHEGSLVGHGTHEDLRATSHYYRRLLQAPEYLLQGETGLMSADER
ncbi:peptidase domain-containing ABC transporter [Paenarthrobacter nitroguajacolicus]|uniref:peptidase domain-containing ABC transporter n=1 Tax=Paenarthrobacter nitroguajacolicus TaxID=211146 RepID=UPI0040545BA1